MAEEKINNPIPLRGKNLRITRKPENHPKAKLRADALFNFMTDLEFLEKVLNTCMLSPRYCVEDVKYLKLKGIHQVAFPMKCFCDINLHNLQEHIKWYGQYAIGLSKDFGIERGLQPIKYVNKNSDLIKGYSERFNSALKESERGDSSNEAYRDYLLMELLFMKPYEGRMIPRGKRNSQTKCFMDENEWRFVPQDSKLKLLVGEPALSDSQIESKEWWNKTIEAWDLVSLQFGYDDIKYIIIPNRRDFDSLRKDVFSGIPSDVRDVLLSRCIIWDDWKGDF